MRQRRKSKIAYLQAQQFHQITSSVINDGASRTHEMFVTTQFRGNNVDTSENIEPIIDCPRLQRRPAYCEAGYVYCICPHDNQTAAPYQRRNKSIKYCFGNTYRAKTMGLFSGLYFYICSHPMIRSK